MRQRILVTGGAGFIGSHTVDLLLSQDREVVVLDNLSSGKVINLNLQQPNLEFIEGDVLDFFLLEALLKNCDAVLHLAAISSVTESIEQPIYTFQVNVQGLLHVLEAVRKSERSIRVVFASSAAIYGATSIACSDEAPVTQLPLTPYGLQKKQAEEQAQLYAKLFAVKSLGLRYFNVYGLRQDPLSMYSGVITRFIDAYKNHEPLVIYGGGNQSRDFIHIQDVARANALALDSDYDGALNIATGHPQTLNQLISDISQAGGKEAQVMHVAARPGDIQTSYAATGLAEKMLGFNYRVPVNQGILEMLGEQI